MINSVDVNGELVITEFTDTQEKSSQSIVETKQEIAEKNKIYEQRAKECIARFKKENERRIALQNKNKEKVQEK